MNVTDEKSNPSPEQPDSNSSALTPSSIQEEPLRMLCQFPMDQMTPEQFRSEIARIRTLRTSVQTRNAALRAEVEEKEEKTVKRPKVDLSKWS